MAARIFLRDVAGCKAGQIEDLDWSAFQQSARDHHGLTAAIDDYSLPIEDAARLYVEGLHQPSQSDGRDRLAGSRTTAPRDESRRPR